MPEYLHVSGLTDFRKALKSVNPEVAKQLVKVHREVAKLAVAAARAASPPRIAPALRPRATAKAARIGFAARGRYIDAHVRYWGMEKRTGWYAAPRYKGATRAQAPKWAGNQWTPGERNGEPYIIGPALNRVANQVDDLMYEGYERAAEKAFPD